jgi:hypothetical protein
MGIEKNTRAKREMITMEWRTLNYEEHNGLYSSPNLVLVIKLRKIG